MVTMLWSTSVDDRAIIAQEQGGKYREVTWAAYWDTSRGERQENCHLWIEDEWERVIVFHRRNFRKNISPADIDSGGSFYRKVDPERVSDQLRVTSDSSFELHIQQKSVLRCFPNQHRAKTFLFGQDWSERRGILEQSSIVAIEELLEKNQGEVHPIMITSCRQRYLDGIHIDIDIDGRWTKEAASAAKRMFLMGRCRKIAACDCLCWFRWKYSDVGLRPRGR